MKWPKSHFDIIDSGFSQFIQNYPHTLEEIRYGIRQYATPMAGMHRLYTMIWGDLIYDDNSPRFQDYTLNDGTVYKAKKRLVKHVPGFQLYPDGCNDSHLNTVLNVIGKKHGLLD